MQNAANNSVYVSEAQEVRSFKETVQECTCIYNVISLIESFFYPFPSVIITLEKGKI